MVMPLLTRPPVGGCGDFGTPIAYTALVGGNNYFEQSSMTGKNAQYLVLNYWIKHAFFTAGIGQAFFVSSTALGGSSYFYIGRTTSGNLYILEANSTTQYAVSSAENFQDTQNFYNVHIEIDTTQTEPSDRVKVWVNGVRLTMSGTFPSLGYSHTRMGGSATHWVTSWAGTPGNPGGSDDMYFANVAYSDVPGAYAYTDFGYFNSHDVWVPRVPDDLSNLSYFLDFMDPLDLGKDISGNDNHLTMIGTPSQRIDTPTRNFATLNYQYLDNVGHVLLSDGALTMTGPSNANNTIGTQVIRHRAFFSMRVDVSGNTDFRIGLRIQQGTSESGLTYAYRPDGAFVAEGVASSYGAPFTVGDTVACGHDPNTGDTEFFKLVAGAWVSQGVISGVVPPNAIICPWFYTSLNTKITANFGQRDWAAPLPQGYNGMDATITPCPATLNPDDYHTVRLRDNGAAVKNLPWNPQLHKTLTLSKNRDNTEIFRIGISTEDGPDARLLKTALSTGASPLPFAIEFTDRGFNHCQKDLHSNYMDFQGTQHFERTQVAPDDPTKWTFGCWIRLKDLTSRHPFIQGSAYSLTGDIEWFAYGSTSVSNASDLRYTWQVDATTYGNAVSGITLQNHAAWQHLVISRDGTSLKVWVDNYLAIDITVSSNNGLMNALGEVQLLGKGDTPGGIHYAEYIMADAHFLDGVAALPTDFAYDNAGIWTPKDYTGLYGNNGWNLNFSNPNDLGFDSSGNDNHFTPSAGVTSANHLLEAYATDPDMGGNRIDHMWRANPKAGFDFMLVDHVSGSDTTLPHNAGGVIDYGWVLTWEDTGSGSRRYIHHKDLSADQYLLWDTTATPGTLAGWFNSTSSDFTIGAAVPSGRYLVALWRGVPQLSAFLLYNGHEDASDGALLVTDFSPRTMLGKSVTNGVAYHFLKTRDLDVSNPMSSSFITNDGYSEALNDWHADFISNGVKWRDASNSTNNGGDRYVAALWAHQPGKFARGQVKMRIVDDETVPATPTICADEGVGIQYSALLDGDNYLNREFAAPSSLTAWTVSTWVRLTGPNSLPILGVGLNQMFYIRADGAVQLRSLNGSAELVSSRVIRDYAKYMHVMLVWKTSEATATSRVKIYINGVLMTSFSIDQRTSIAQGSSSHINAAVSHYIGNYIGGDGLGYGYLADYIFLDGIAAAPTDFGYFNEQMHWVKRTYAGVYGNNGFHLDFADPADMGKDVSGNGNHWLSPNSQLVQHDDSPTKTFNTNNPLNTQEVVTLSDGNLVGTYSGVNNVGATTGTHVISDGIYYWEHTWDTIGPQENNVGVIPVQSVVIDANPYSASTNGAFVGAEEVIYTDTGQICRNGYLEAYGPAPVSGTVIGVLVNCNNNTIDFSYDGVWQGPTALCPKPFVSTSTNYGGSVGRSNFGQRSYAYPMPAGASKLATSAYRCPAIVNPDDYFTIRRRQGNTFVVNDLPWNPLLYKTLVVTKRLDLGTDVRSSDSVLGDDWINEINNPGPGGTSPGMISFTPTGYSLHTSTATNAVYAGDSNDFIWRASRTSGMDIINITHTNGVATTVLQETGGAIHYGWVINLTTGNKRIFHHKMASGYYVGLNGQGVQTLDTGWFSSTATELTLGANMPSGNYILYVWRTIPGFSSFDIYRGTGAVNGPTTVMDFLPRIHILRGLSGTGLGHSVFASDWVGNTNPANQYVHLNDSDYGLLTAGEVVDMTAGAVKQRTGSGRGNWSGVDFITANWALTPFKFARAR